jgi:hypothetical protein
LTDAQRALHVFELRTYESRNAFALKDKPAMSNLEEIKIFRNCGFATLFFGEAVFATRMSHLNAALDLYGRRVDIEDFPVCLI